MNDFLSWFMHLLVPFLFHDLTSLHPPSFHRNDFSTCSTHFSFLGKASSKMCHVLCAGCEPRPRILTRTLAHTDNAPFTRACKWRHSVPARVEAHDLP